MLCRGGLRTRKSQADICRQVYKALRRHLSCQGGVSVAAGGSVDLARGVELP